VKERPTRKSGTLEPQHQDPYVNAMYRRGAHYGMLADLMIWSGARIMAAAAIQNRDVDFDVGIIRIRRLIERATKTPVDRTKGEGDDGAEIIPLFPKLKDRILAHLRISDYTRPTDFIAAAPGGGWVSYEGYRDAHFAVLKELSLARFTPHAIRKAFATNAKRGWIHAGRDPGNAWPLERGHDE
jgi:integrase